MKRKEKILILLLVFPLLGAGLRPLDLKLNGNLLETPLLEKEGEFFMPIKAFSQLTSMQLTERSSGHVLLFRDNIFIKFNLNSNIYYLNGKEYSWKNPPFKEKEEIYIPHRIILDFMNYHYKLTQDEIAITGGAYDMSLSYLQNRQRVDFVDAKISYAVPYFWSRENPNSFSHNESKTSLTVSVSKLEDEALEKLMEKSLAAKELEDFSALNPKQYSVDGIKILHQGYRRKEDKNENIYRGYSYLILENRLVETLFQAETSSLSSAINLEDEIINSIHFNAYTIDEMEEHYVELAAFYAMQMELELPLYSNMLVDNKLTLKGTIHPSVDRLKATVRRGKRSFTYTFPVDKGSFNAKIPIPFGLGFHSLSLSMAPGDEDLQKESSPRFFVDENTLLKFSVLNTSLNEGLFLSDSDFVPSQDRLVGELSSQVRNINYDYGKAQALLQILGDNFTGGQGDSPQAALEDKKLSRKTAALIYGAMLRRAGVPTRIISNRSQTLFGVEILSNGSWHKIDPYNYLINKGRLDDYMSLPQDHFGPNYIEHDI
ncbi:MAG: hypothetical protein GX079_05670 [Tissierellia bacterium]|nr:hypothetical protein [Tissierellia bacterium]